LEAKDQNENIHILKDINISFQKGKFVMILGDIGSGKSSLLLSILNEMIHHEQSKVFISGSIAYSPQKPWIMSKTVE
jgi:ABC-type lipoprotein export system ATPase subunit